MTVGELLAQLELLDPDILIVTSESGGDYNYYSEHAYVEAGWFRVGKGESEFYADDAEDYTPQPGDLRAVAVQ